MNTRILANLRHPMQIAFNAALHIRHVLERSPKLFFFLLAMRTPPRAIHFHAPISQAPRERIMLVLASSIQIQNRPEYSHDD